MYVFKMLPKEAHDAQDTGQDITTWLPTGGSTFKASTWMCGSRLGISDLIRLRLTLRQRTSSFGHAFPKTVAGTKNLSDGNEEMFAMMNQECPALL